MFQLLLFNNENLKFSIKRHLYKEHAVILNFIKIKYIYIK